jgi:hypothetical protein
LSKIRLERNKRDNTNCVLLRSDESGISKPAPICMDKIVSSISLNSPVTGQKVLDLGKPVIPTDR